MCDNIKGNCVQRIGILFRLKPGTKEEYRKRHDHIWQEVRDVLTQAGIHNYSIWNHDEILFAYFETEDLEKAQRTMDSSEIFQKWRKYMEDVVLVDPASGQKEYFMEQVFYHA